MKIAVALAILISSGWLTSAQTNDVDVGDMLDAAQQFAQDNLDPDVLQALQQVDRAKVEDFLNHFEDYLKGNSVLDAARLKDAANTILPLLDAHDETQPYAAWLRARLDYFDAADELKSLTPAPKPEPGTNTPSSLPNPPFKAEQEIWIKKISPRPWPKGAEQFVPKLKTIFAAEGVPSALVWLAEVESGFDARARSPAGAVGMFQLMPATAKENGLSLFPFDQRKQMEPAAHAAANNLRQLHDQLGDWRLAVSRLQFRRGHGAAVDENATGRRITKPSRRICRRKLRCMYQKSGGDHPAPRRVGTGKIESAGMPSVQ